MSTGTYPEAVLAALHSNDLARIKDVLARGHQLLQDYGDVAAQVRVLEYEIAKIENRRD